MVIKIKHLISTTVILAIICLLVLAIYSNHPLSQSREVSTKPSVRLPIIMYHQILKDPKAWGKYVISPDDFEKDLVYLLENGYTTVDMQDLIDYVYNDKDLPDKPIMLTFDDGYLTSEVYVLPLLKKYNCKVVVSIVGIFTDRFTENMDTKLSYAHLNWGNVRELVNSEYIEIQNHSYDMHKNGKRNGIGRMKGESLENYKKALNKDILYMQNLMQKNTGYTPTTFTYPFGTMSKESEEILKEMGFLGTLSCYEGVNTLTGNKDDLYRLKRYNRPYNIDRIKFFSKLE